MLWTFFLVPMMKEIEDLILLVWSVSYVLAESLECEGSISSSSFYGQSADNYSLFFILIHPKDEFSFKEMRKWGQSMISSCSLCVRCESRELGVGERQGCSRLSTPMAESFFTDFLSAIENYWMKSHFEFCRTSMTELLCESMWNAFRWLG